jgi:hypothetical protein
MKPSEPDDLKNILAELDASRAAYRAATMNVQLAVKLGADLGLSNSDGSLALKHANRAAREAMERYHAAVKAFDEHLSSTRKAASGG